MTNASETWQWLKSISKAARYKWMERQIMRGVCLQIRAMRKARNWSRKELAQKSGVGAMTIFRLERLPWTTWPSVRTLTKLAAAFDVALVIRFCPWSEMVAWACGLPRSDKGLCTSALYVKQFSEDTMFIPECGCEKDRCFGPISGYSCRAKNEVVQP